MISAQESTHTARAHLALIAVAMIYGANHSIAKIAMSSPCVNADSLVFLRLLGGTVLMWIIFWRLDLRLIAAQDWLRLVLCALFGTAANMLLFFRGLELTTPINSALIMTTSPIMALVLAFLWRQEAMSILKVMGILLAALGSTILILYKGHDVLPARNILGDIFILINAMFFALFLVIGKSLMTKYHPMLVMKALFPLGLLMVLPFAWEELGEIRFCEWSTTTTLSVLFVIICTTFMTYALNGYALSKVHASVVSSYTYLQPFFATLFALLLGLDRLHISNIFGGVLIVFGVLLISIPNLDKKT